MSNATYNNQLHGHSSHIDILRDNPIDEQSYITYSPTDPSVETDDIHRY